MKRVIVGGVLVLSVLLVVNLVSFFYAGADVSWEAGDLSLVASRLGVQPEPDGKYDLSKLLLAITDKLPGTPPETTAAGPVLTLAVTPAGSGVTTPEAGSHTYALGTSVALSAGATSGYRFDRWEGSVSGSADEATVVMDADKSVTAVFVKTYSVTVAASPADGGTVSPAAGTSIYDAGTTLDLSATPNPGYRFDHWDGAAGGTAAQTTVTVDGDTSVTAAFVRTYALTLDVSPAGAGTTTPASGTSAYDTGTSVTLTATASSGYRFDHWEGDLSGTALQAALLVDGDKSVTAVFTETYTLTAGAAPVGGGTVTPSGSATYDVGTSVALSATAAAGYTFDHWEGDLSGGASQATLSMDGNKTVTAVFVECTAQIADRALEVSRGSYATLHAQTTPNAYCTIDVILPSGDKSQEQGLEPKWANGDGLVFWTWLVSYTTPTGQGQITVTANANQASAHDAVTWSVLDPRT